MFRSSRLTAGRSERGEGCGLSITLLRVVVPAPHPSSCCCPSTQHRVVVQHLSSCGCPAPFIMWLSSTLHHMFVQHFSLSSTLHRVVVQHPSSCGCPTPFIVCLSSTLHCVVVQHPSSYGCPAPFIMVLSSTLHCVVVQHPSSCGLTRKRRSCWLACLPSGEDLTLLQSSRWCSRPDVLGQLA